MEKIHTLEANPGFHAFSLESKRLGIAGGKQIASVLARETALSVLKLRFTCLSDRGAECIAPIFKQSCPTKLTIVDFAGNDIKDKGAAKIAAALVGNSCLKTLNLNFNGIGDQGAAWLATCLSRNRSLIVLDLSCNEISDQGAVEIAKSLLDNNTLVELNLECNDISTYGAIKLARALQKNKSLRKLNVAHNRIGAEESRKIEQIMLRKGLKASSGDVEISTTHCRCSDHTDHAHVDLVHIRVQQPRVLVK
jgi:Ran GTPase-activating protein (RanGAP) involved in mRNA processing and transport